MQYVVYSTAVKTGNYLKRLVVADTAQEARAVYAKVGLNTFVEAEPLSDALAAGFEKAFRSPVTVFNKWVEERVKHLRGAAPTTIASASTPEPEPESKSAGPRKPPRTQLVQEWLRDVASTPEGRRELAESTMAAVRAMCGK